MKRIIEDEEYVWRAILQEQLGWHYLRVVLGIVEEKKPQTLTKLKDTKGEAA